MIALSGVRSSWLMFAKNSLLLRLAARAASLAFSSARLVSCSACSFFRRSLMSRLTATWCVMLPRASRTGASVQSKCTSVPFFALETNNPVHTLPERSVSSSSLKYSGG